MQVGSIVTPNVEPNDSDFEFWKEIGIMPLIQGDPYVVSWIGPSPSPDAYKGLALSLEERGNATFKAKSFVELMPPDDIAEIVLEESEYVEVKELQDFV